MRTRIRRCLRPLAELTVAGIGLFCCMATSRETGPEPQPEPIPEDDAFGESGDNVIFPDINADLLIHNATDDEQVVRIRSLKSAVDVDCDVVTNDPATLLTESLFGPAATWTVPPDTNVAVVEHGIGERTCYAAWIEADGLDPVIAFWRDGFPAQSWWQGAGLPDIVGALVLDWAGPRLALDDGGDKFLFTPRPSDPQNETCAPAQDGKRVAWSTPVPTGVWQVESAEPGLDGCMSLSLVAEGAEFSEPPWYVCASADAFPFAAGDTISVENLYDTGIEGVRLRGHGVNIVDGEELVVARGGELPSLADLTLSVEELGSCGFGVEERCGTLTRATQLRVESPVFGDGVVRGGGDTLELLSDDGRRLRVEGVVSQERAALDPECASGPDVLGGDVELTIATFKVEE